MSEIAVLVLVGDVTPLAVECLSSLRKHSNCEIRLYCTVDQPSRLPCPIRPLPMDWTDRRMSERFRLATTMGIHGDTVLLLDTDMIFKADPFEVFLLDFDLCYTTRPVHNHRSPVNGGFSGWRVNERTKRLFRFLLAQIDEPTWPAYQVVRKRLCRDDRRMELDWWTHQDLLCTLHKSGAPTPCKLYNVGPEWNWCPDSGGGRTLTPQAREQFFETCRDPDVHVIHYKELKTHVQPRDFVFQ